MRVATWNVREGVPEGYEKRPPHSTVLDDMAAKVRELELDLLVLQEVDFSSNGDSHVINAIKSDTHLQNSREYSYSPSSFYAGMRAGMALVTRFPIVRHSSFLLPNPDLKVSYEGRQVGTFDKGVLSCVVDMNGIRTSVVAVHMFPFHMFERSASDPAFASGWEHIRRLIARLGEPLIVAGDFNTSKRDLVVRGSEQRLQSAVDAQITHRGFSADDILYSAGRFRIDRVDVLDNFSDHQLCVAELAVQ